MPGYTANPSTRWPTGYADDENDRCISPSILYDPVMPDDAKPNEQSSFASIDVTGDTSVEELVVAAAKTGPPKAPVDPTHHALPADPVDAMPADLSNHRPQATTGENESGQPSKKPSPRVSPRELRLVKRNRHAFIACVLTAIFMVVLLWSTGLLRRGDSSELLGIVPSVLFEDMCSNVAKDHLDKLHVTEFEVTDEMIPQVIKLDSLETLILDRGVVTDRSMNPISALPKLRHLRLRHSPITDEGLRTLAQCESLWYINLPHANCTADGIAALAQLPRLRQLRLGSRNLGNEVADSIALIESLRGIHLIGVAVTDEGLKTMAAMPHLESLYLDDSKVTEAGWEWIFKNFPQIHVHVNQSHHDRDPKAHVHHD